MFRMTILFYYKLYGVQHVFFGLVAFDIFGELDVGTGFGFFDATCLVGVFATGDECGCGQ